MGSGVLEGALCVKWTAKLDRLEDAREVKKQTAREVRGGEEIPGKEDMGKMTRGTRQEQSYLEKMSPRKAFSLPMSGGWNFCVAEG